MSLAPRIDRLDSNLLINGNFDFWQRGTSITPSGDQYLADRWQNHSGVTTNYSRQSGGPNSTSQFFARVTGPSGLIGLSQKVESVFARYITEANLTFSFWAKVASGTSSVSVQVRTPSVVDNFASNTLILSTVVGTVTTSWQKFTFIVPVTNDMKSLGFMLSAAIVGAVSATTLDLAQCVLLQGQIDDPNFCLASLNYSDELSLCRRYFISMATTTSYGSTTIRGFRRLAGDNGCDFVYPLEREMRAIPSMYAKQFSNPNNNLSTTFGTGAAQLNIFNWDTWSNLTGTAATVAVSVLTTKTNQVEFRISATALSGAAGAPVSLDMNDVNLGLDAEIPG